MTATERIGLHSVIWIILLAITLLVILRRRNAVGLTATFLVTYLANHWLGSAIYVLPWSPLHPSSEVAAGLEQSLWGMAAFAFGALILSPILTPGLLKRPSGPPPDHQVGQEFPKQIRTYLLIGVGFHILPSLFPFLGRIPTFSTFVSMMTKFTVFAACLFVYARMRSGSRNTWRYVFLVAGAFPLVGAVFTGFASFGSVISILVIMFYLSYNRIDIKKIMFLVLTVYLGLSGFVVYLRDRTDIRGAAWGHAPLRSRLQVAVDSARHFELFSFRNPEHLALVDIRLNRNYFVGAAARNLEAGTVDYARGQTFLDALVAPIPRALWPGKPRISGDNTMVTQSTGISFNPGTAVGSGPLFEGFVNFGSAGVIGLFAFYGVLLSVCDAQSRRALDAGRYFSFAIWSLPLIELLHNVEPTGSIVAPAIFTILAFKVSQRYFERSGSERHRLEAYEPASFVPRS